MKLLLSKEKFKKIDLIPIIQSVVDDYNNIYQTKKSINISFKMMVKKIILLMELKIELNK